MVTEEKKPDAVSNGYQSQYGDQITAGLNKVTNREAFSYDPLKDANYQAMAKIYNQQGNKAAKDTLGDAAALNGGYGSSYAVTASQQMRNDYNQQLASQIPALEQAAYGRWKDSYDMDVTNLQLLQDADDRDYGRHRDDVADSQWQKTFDRSVLESDRDFDYQKSRDTVADTQWQKSYDRSVFESNRDYNYQKSRDKVADTHWAKEFALAKKGSASGGGSSSGGGYIGSSSGGGYISGSGSSNYEKAKGDAAGGNSGGNNNNNKNKNKNKNKSNSRNTPIAGGGR